MKKILVSVVFLLGISFAQASCVDLPTNLTKGKESSSVLSLQNFLKEKGYLKAVPNGYYGAGTQNAVKLYQKSKGLTRSGQVFPLTRAAIKLDTCATSSSLNTQTEKKPTSSPTAIITGTSTLAPVVVLSEPERNNLQRKQDVIAILKALYAYNKDTLKFLVPINSTSTEICSPTSTSTCGTMIDLSSLVPNFLPKIPNDPNKKTIGGSGYTVNRNENNGFTVSSLFKENGGQVSVMCYFSDACKIIDSVSVSGSLPLMITSIDRTALVIGGVGSKALVIHGQGFDTTGNSVFFTPALSQRSFMVSSTSPSTDGKTISIENSFVNNRTVCGVNCYELLQPGRYGVMVKNSRGESNSHYLEVKGVTVGSLSARPDTSITPNSTNVKLGTVTFSSNFLVGLKNFSLTNKGSAKAAAKFSNYKLKELTAATSTLSGPTFTFPKQDILENQSKIYEIYADVGNVLSDESGAIYFGGTFTIYDYLSGNDIQVPIKEFIVTVSY